jgi:hypothetical protein
MKQRESEGKRKQFNEIAWHDSEILSFELTEKGATYELLLRLSLFEKDNNFAYEKNFRILKFTNCRIIQMDLDLLGMKLCGATIASAFCDEDGLTYAVKTRERTNDFDLPQDRLPLQNCFVFMIEMTPPTGTITVFAENFIFESS